jgi:uncharacterized protein (DUF58 family)
MPTGRFYSFLFASLLFYLFANQTQVGWLYVVSALLGGILITGFVLNRRSLKGIGGRRKLLIEPDAPLHESDDLTITLYLENQRRTPAAHLHLIERCPLAAPTDEVHESAMFVPILTDTVSFDYNLTVYRRGVHHFPDIELASRAPFGFFRRKGVLKVDTSVLVYPEVRRMRQFSLLDKQPAAQLTNPRAGLGSEVIGVRDYRSGDSPRHIHWRSVARRGQLISKEFAEETQPGVTVVLDRYCPLDPLPTTKYTPFEMAVKCTVSMAAYAIQRQYPVYLAADSEGLAFPQGAIVWDALMQYMARVETRNQSNLSDILNYQPMQQFVAIALAWPDETVLETLIAMKQRGYNLFVALPDPTTYPIDTAISAQGIQSALEQTGIDVAMVAHGTDWAPVLSGE